MVVELTNLVVFHLIFPDTAGVLSQTYLPHNDESSFTFLPTNFYHFLSVCVMRVYANERFA